MVFRRQDQAVAVEETKEGRARAIWRGPGAIQHFSEFGERVLIQVINVAFLQRGPESHRMRKRQAFFGDRLRLSGLDFQERLNAILKLRVEQLLLVTPPIFLR